MSEITLDDVLVVKRPVVLQRGCHFLSIGKIRGVHQLSNTPVKTLHHAIGLIYPIKSGQIKKRVFGKNLPQSLPDSDSDWQSVTEADCSRFRCIQTPFGARLHG